MSFKRTPFQFSDFNADDRRSELLRRFGFQPEQGSNMFYEPSAPSWSDWPGRLHRPGFYDPDWRNTGSFFSGSGGSAPGSPQPRMRNRGWSSPTVDVDGVPIKVVHEQSDDGDNHSDTSSQGSNGSKLRHEPRVHHIPIMVEPRDGSSSSGYGSDGENKRQTAGGVPSPASGAPIQKVSSPVEKKIHTVPIRVQCGDGTTAEPLAKSSVKQEGCNGEPVAVPDRGWANTFPRQKCQQTPAKTAPNTTTKSSSGGTIPTTGQRAGESSRQQGSRPKSPGVKGRPPPNSAGESSKGSLPPEEVIRRINFELKDLKEQVYNFRGEQGDKQYRFLDEMLTRLMLRLDTIDPAGNDEIRRMRKLAINDVQRVINRLEGKEQPCTDLVAIGERELVEADEEGELEAVEEHEAPAVVSPPPGGEERSGYASFKGSSSNYLSSCNLCNVLGGESESGRAGGPDPAKIVEHGGGRDGVADDATLVLDEVPSVPEPADLSSSGEMMSGPVNTTLTASGGDRDVYSQLDPDASSMIDQGVARGNSSEEGIRTPYNENALSLPSYMGEASLEASGERSDPSVSESGFTDL